MTYTPDQVCEALERAALDREVASLDTDEAIRVRANSDATIVRWLAENYARMEADAERYRWLRDASKGRFEHPICVSLERNPIRMRYIGPLIGAELDAAIDKARQP